MSTLRFFTRAIDRFCYRHPKFGIPNLMLFIIIGQGIVFLFSQMDTTGLFRSALQFSPQLILKGQVWRLVTFVFVPEFSNLFTLAISLYFYYFVGGSLERQWGPGKFTIFYLSGVLLTMLYGIIAGLLSGSEFNSLSPHYINLSMFFAFATLFPETRLLLFFIIPIKVKYLGYLNAALFLYGVLTSPFPLSLLPLVAILNYFVFCGDILLSSFGGLKRRVSPQAINFRKASRQFRQAGHNQAASSSRPYQRKCSVCGRTDTDYPNLEFRYCSRCAGYHCFCIDHINAHVHFTE